MEKEEEKESEVITMDTMDTMDTVKIDKTKTLELEHAEMVDIKIGFKDLSTQLKLAAIGGYIYFMILCITIIVIVALFLTGIYLGF